MIFFRPSSNANSSRKLPQFPLGSCRLHRRTINMYLHLFNAHIILYLLLYYKNWVYYCTTCFIQFTLLSIIRKILMFRKTTNKPKLVFGSIFSESSPKSSIISIGHLPCPHPTTLTPWAARASWIWTCHSPFHSAAYFLLRFSLWWDLSPEEQGLNLVCSAPCMGQDQQGELSICVQSTTCRYLLIIWARALKSQHKIRCS